MKKSSAFIEETVRLFSEHCTRTAHGKHALETSRIKGPVTEFPSGINAKMPKHVPLGLQDFRWKRRFTNQDKEYLANTWEAWLYQKEEMTICLQEQETDTIVAIPYNTRYSKKYARRTRAKINSITKQYNPNKGAVFLTLTTDPGMHTGAFEATRAIWQNWNKLKTRIVKKRRDDYATAHGLKKKDVPIERLKYCAVLEFQHNEYMNPHLHIVILDKSWVLPVHEIWGAWEKYQGSHVDIQKVNGRTGARDIAAYIAKYMNKTFLAYEHGEGVHDFTTQQKAELAFYWLTNSRFYNTSRGFFIPYKKNRTGRTYEFVGLLRGDTVVFWDPDTPVHIDERWTDPDD